MKRTLLSLSIFILVIGALVTSFQNCGSGFMAPDAYKPDAVIAELTESKMDEVQNRGTIVYWALQDKILVQKDPLFLDRMTVFAIFDGSKDVDIFHATSGAAENDQVRISVEGGHIMIYRYSDLSNYETYDVGMAQPRLQTLAVNFKQNKKSEKIMLDGVSIGGVVHDVGVLADFYYLEKRISSFKNIETMVVMEDLTLYEMNLLSYYLAKKNGVSPITLNQSLPNTDVEVGTDVVKTRAEDIIQTKCASCHQHEGWKGYTIESFLQSGEIASKSPSDSLLYNRVVRQEMPPSAPLTSDEVAIIRQWILSY